MSGRYPNNRDRFKSSSRGPDVAGQAVSEALQEFIVVTSLGLWILLKSFFSKQAVFSIPVVSALAYVSFYVIKKHLHIEWLHESMPEVLTYERLKRINQIPLMWQYLVLFSFFLSPLVLSIGIVTRSTRTKFQLLFQRIGLTNGIGDTPKLVYTKRINKDRSFFIFDPNGLGIDEFEAKRERMESHFRSNIESIKHGRHKGLITITLSKLAFPDKVSYLDMTTQHVLPSESFYLGVSVEGIKTQKVAELPHMLIAGTTGSGKSVFFKQALMGLLESSNHMQMYLIDLKGGLEMIDFVKAPNVKIVKTMDQAVHLLKLVENEMKARFAYLEKENRKQINPGEDKKDRIIVGVDEASVLYMNRSRIDPDYEASVEARRLADSISKLSRAAAIHLLLATQKLDRQVIPTSVSENISGRMAFRANSLQGSLIVLGTKDASELPEIPGRGIWNFGTKKMIIQSPYIDEKSIGNRCEQIAQMYEDGKRKLLSPMLGETEKKVGMKNQNIAYAAVKEKL